MEDQTAAFLYDLLQALATSKGDEPIRKDPIVRKIVQEIVDSNVPFRLRTQAGTTLSTFVFEPEFPDDKVAAVPVLQQSVLLPVPALCETVDMVWLLRSIIVDPAHESPAKGALKALDELHQTLSRTLVSAETGRRLVLTRVTPLPASPTIQ